ncbi:MAG TPA: copper resistance protein CopC [Ktedonobacteraceae bacterium]|nr:copper resistance protein CopC [Ktedonobacteraceae bacterium]
MRQKHHLRLLLGGLAGLGVLLMWNWLPVFSQSPVALAHGFVIGSDPVDGSTIPGAPAVVRIFFNADISTASRVQVFVFVPGGSPGGSEIDRGISVVPAGHAMELDTPLLSPATLPQGSYEVRWTAVASDDGHATHGLIGFNVGVSATGLTGTTIIGPSTSNILPQMDLPGVLATLWEWVTLAALTFWIGLVAMEAIFVFGVMPSTHGAADNAIRLLRKQGRPLQWLCLYALLAGEIINLVLRGMALSEFQQSGSIDLASLGAVLLQTGYGYLWLARLGLIACALVFGWWTTRAVKKTHISSRGRAMRAIRGQVKGEAAQRLAPTSSTAASSRYRQLRLQIEDELTQEHEPHTDGYATFATEMTPEDATVVSRRHSITWLLLASLIALTIAYSSDTAQLAQTHITAIALNWLYLLAQSAWLGGVAYLGFVLLPLLPTIEPETHGTLLVNVLRYYVPLLLAALGVLLLNGLFSIETTINSPDQLINDPYGRTLLIAQLFFTLLVIFSAYSFFYLLPATHRQMVLLPVVNADLPARRARRSALEQSISSLKRAMHILSLLGAGILLCVALMAFYAPPIVFPPATSGTGSAQGTSTAQSIQTKTVGTLVISLQVSPARADTTNFVTVILKDTDGSSVTNARVQLRTNMQIMDMGTATKAAQGQAGNSSYTASFTPDEAFSMLGTWVISLTIQQTGQPAAQTQFFVTLLE